MATQLAFAKGNDLDVWGANFDVKRLVITAADDSITPPASAVYEEDEDFRYRIQKKLDALSTAGPESAYEFHTLSADSRVADVKCNSPAPAHALLTILQRDTSNNASTEELNKIVYDYVSADTKRPTGDRVLVQSAEIINYEIEAVLVTKMYLRQNLFYLQRKLILFLIPKSRNVLARVFFLRSLLYFKSFWR